MSRLRSRFPDVVPNVDDGELRRIYGANADEVIAFREYLRAQGHDPAIPPASAAEAAAFRDYATGTIDGRELLARLRALRSEAA